jgi:hypothetical protein
MAGYFVTWSIDIEAESAGEAAAKALAIQRDPDSIATIFQVGLRDEFEDVREEIDAAEVAA